MNDLEGVIPELKLRIQGMLADGNGVLTVSSGFRTWKEQAELYSKFLEGKGAPANPPGHSKHEKGEAVDIECEPAFNSLRKDLAAKWGLAQYYKKEPWHLELSPKRKPLPTPVKVMNMLKHPAVGFVPTLSDQGYYVVASDGGVFNFGDAKFFGSMGGQPLNAPVIGMALTRSGLGYWLYASDGGVFNFGDATLFKSEEGKYPTEYIK